MELEKLHSGDSGGCTPQSAPQDLPTSTNGVEGSTVHSHASIMETTCRKEVLLDECEKVDDENKVTELASTTEVSDFLCEETEVDNAASA